MIDHETFVARAERSMAEGVCLMCDAPCPDPPPGTPVMAIGEHADTLARMCDDCLRDFLEWREQDVREGRLS